MVPTFPHPLSHLLAVGIFPERPVARQVVSNLKAVGIPISQISLIAREHKTPKNHVETGIGGEEFHPVDEGFTLGALSGGALGSLTGLLVGLGTIAIPGVGPVMLAGGVATAIATTLAGGTIGAVAGSLLGALVGLGIPEAEAQLYHNRIAQGDCLVLVKGTAPEIQVAATIFQQFNVENYQVYEVAENAASIQPVIGVGKAPPPIQPLSVPTPVHGAPTQSNFTSSKYGVGIFATRYDAERAIHSLKAIGFPIHQITLTTQQIDPLGSVAGVPLSDRLETMRLGMSAERARFYHDQLTQGQYIITATGTEQELLDAGTVLVQQGVLTWQMYDPSAINPVLPTPPISSAPPVSSAPVPSVTEPSGVATQMISEFAAAPANYTLPTDVNTISQTLHRAVGVFQTLQLAEVVLTALHQVAFPMHQVALLMKHLPNQVIPGTVGNYVVGIGTMAIPGIGNVLVGGATATNLVGAALSKGALIAATGGIVQAMVEQQIPETAAHYFKNSLIAGNTILIVDGTEAQLHSAENVFKQSQLTNWQFFQYVEPESMEQPFIEPDNGGLSSHMKKQNPNVTVVDRRRKAK